ncbi:MAG: hypothetical protein WC091_01215 [Sulfuricellaceae bacterium]
MDSEIDYMQQINDFVCEVGGAEEALALLADYRRLVGNLATARDARTVLPDMRCWASRRQLCRMAMDLPDVQGRAFLGR